MFYVLPFLAIVWRAIFTTGSVVELGLHARNRAGAGHGALLLAEPSHFVRDPTPCEGGRVPAVLEGRPPLWEDQGAEKRRQVRS